MSHPYSEQLDEQKQASEAAMRAWMAQRPDGISQVNLSQARIDLRDLIRDLMPCTNQLETMERAELRVRRILDVLEDK